MKRIIIIYFSLTGNTRRLSYLIRDFLLKKECEVSCFNLPVDKKKSFLRNVFDAIFCKKVEVETPDFSGYDTLFLGCPVWAFDIVPAMRSFIRKVNFGHKDVFLFITYGSGAGKDRAMKNFINLVREKGGNVREYFEVKGKIVEKEFEKVKKRLEEFI